MVAAYTDLPRARPPGPLARAGAPGPRHLRRPRARRPGGRLVLPSRAPRPAPPPTTTSCATPFGSGSPDAAGVDAVTRGLSPPTGTRRCSSACAHAAPGRRGRPATPWIVAGADSQVDVGLLEALDHAARRLQEPPQPRRVHPGARPRPRCSSSTAAAPRPRGAPILAEIEGLGRRGRAEPIESGDPPSGEALAAALAAACTAGGPPAWVLCDLNGESYRAKEWGLARVRAPALLGGVRALWHPADSYGDVGAATGGCLAAACVRSFERRRVPRGARRALRGLRRRDARRRVPRLGCNEEGVKEERYACHRRSQLTHGRPRREQWDDHRFPGRVPHPRAARAAGPHPYPNIAMSSDAASTAKNVKADGNPLCHQDSNFSRSSGDRRARTGRRLRREHEQGRVHQATRSTSRSRGRAAPALARSHAPQQQEHPAHAARPAAAHRHRHGGAPPAPENPKDWGVDKIEVF